MPSIPDRTQQQKPVQARVETPADFPDIPQEILDRFPSAADWQKRLQDFWQRTNQAIQDSQVQVANQVNAMTVFTGDSFKVSDLGKIARKMFAVDGTGIRLGHVLVVDTDGFTLHVGVGKFGDATTPIYMDVDGRFSLGDSFAFDPSGGSGLNVIITGGSIDNTPIGQAIPSAGAFTQLVCTDEVIQNTRPELRLLYTGVTAMAHLQAGIGGTVFLAENLSYDGANFMRDDIASFGALLSLSVTGVAAALAYYSATAGANPAALTLIMTVDGNGMTLAGSITTAAPTVGAAASWKLGGYTAGVAAQAGKIRVNVGGSDYDLLTA